MTPAPTYPNYLIDRYRSDTKNHELTILHDDGLYRHLRVARAGSSMYYFDLLTWPGRLSIVGDVQPGWVFSRVEDMFEFFRSPNEQINPTYWSEKVITGRAEMESFSEEKFRAYVTEVVDQCEESWPGLREAVKEQIFDDDAGSYMFDQEAFDALGAFHFSITENERTRWFQFDLADARFRDWDWSFLWCCHAIVDGIARYDHIKAEQFAAVAA
jgi:hypothetical protein